MFGMGPLRNDMVALATKRGLADRLAIRDVFREPLVAPAAFDACLLTSGAEQRPDVALETLGTPVIAMVGGGTREALDLGRQRLADGEAVYRRACEGRAALSDPNSKVTAAVRGSALSSMDRMLR